MTDLSKLKSLADWPTTRGEIEKAVLGVLGALPRERVDIQVKTADEVQRHGYVRRRINYFVDEWERISAWVFVPDGKEELPAIVCCHQRAPYGKDEPAGLDGDAKLAFAARYAELGYVTMVPDCVCMGERVSHGTKACNATAFYKDNPKGSLLGKMLADHMCAVDVLCDMRRVDAARIGVIGHGLGAVNALLLAAFDERVTTCVASCGFARFADDKEPQRWATDDEFPLIPALRKAIKEGKFPFDWEHVLALAAPSPTLVLAASNDPEVPNAKSSEKAVKAARHVYKLLGAEDALQCAIHANGHAMPASVMEKADEWLERWL